MVRRYQIRHATLNSRPLHRGHESTSSTVTGTATGKTCKQPAHCHRLDSHGKAVWAGSGPGFPHSVIRASAPRVRRTRKISSGVSRIDASMVTVFVVLDESPKEFSRVKWGLIPSWAKDKRIASSLINARSETVATKSAFRTAFKKRRCLVPADGFFEWKKVGAAKQPYNIGLKGDEPFAFAGLWETWRDPTTQDQVRTCSINHDDAQRSHGSTPSAICAKWRDGG
jgi:hypothetical protein